MATAAAAAMVAAAAVATLAPNTGKEMALALNTMSTAQPTSATPPPATASPPAVHATPATAEPAVPAAAPAVPAAASAPAAVDTTAAATTAAVERAAEALPIPTQPEGALSAEQLAFNISAKEAAANAEEVGPERPSPPSTEEKSVFWDAVKLGLSSRFQNFKTVMQLVNQRPTLLTDTYGDTTNRPFVVQLMYLSRNAALGQNVNSGVLTGDFANYNPFARRTYRKSLAEEDSNKLLNAAMSNKTKPEREELTQEQIDAILKSTGRKGGRHTPRRKRGGASTSEIAKLLTLVLDQIALESSVESPDKALTAADAFAVLVEAVPPNNRIVGAQLRGVFDAFLAYRSSATSNPSRKLIAAVMFSTAKEPFNYDLIAKGTLLGRDNDFVKYVKANPGKVANAEKKKADWAAAEAIVAQNRSDPAVVAQELADQKARFEASKNARFGLPVAVATSEAERELTPEEQAVVDSETRRLAEVDRAKREAALNASLSDTFLPPDIDELRRADREDIKTKLDVLAAPRQKWPTMATNEEVQANIAKDWAENQNRDVRIVDEPSPAPPAPPAAAVAVPPAPPAHLPRGTVDDVLGSEAPIPPAMTEVDAAEAAVAATGPRRRTGLTPRNLGPRSSAVPSPEQSAAMVSQYAAAAKAAEAEAIAARARATALATTFEDDSTSKLEDAEEAADEEAVSKDEAFRQRLETARKKFEEIYSTIESVKRVPGSPFIDVQLKDAAVIAQQPKKKKRATRMLTVADFTNSAREWITASQGKPTQRLMRTATGWTRNASTVDGPTLLAQYNEAFAAVDDLLPEETAPETAYDAFDTITQMQFDYLLQVEARLASVPTPQSTSPPAAAVIARARGLVPRQAQRYNNVSHFSNVSSRLHTQGGRRTPRRSKKHKTRKSTFRRHRKH